MSHRSALLVLIVLLFPAVLLAQKRVYYDKDNEVVDSTGVYKYSLELTKQPNGWTYVKRFDTERQLEKEGAYSVFRPKERIAEGLHKYYAGQDTLYYTETYQAGQLQELRSWYAGGQLKRIEHYTNGEFKDGECFHEDGSARPFTRFQQVPLYPGGEAALMKYLSDSIQYPRQAFKNNIEGTVAVTFVVNKDGSVSDVTIVKDIGGGCGEEAARLVRNMQQWSPGMADDKPVKVRYTLPMKFKITGNGLQFKRKKKKD